MDTIAPGVVIAGKYKVEREIGRGGMGVVFAALHVDLDQPVAVKILHDYAAYDQAAVARLLREARAAAKIASNHVVRVMDVGALPDGGAYIAMELLEGRDLADILREHGPFQVVEAVDMMIEACDAVAAAHGAGIIHRDLKPANLFVAEMPDGSSMVKVLDFGVSKIVPKSGQTPLPGELTQTGQIFGSPSYMSPEQLRSATDVDGRTDIWALGVVFYELVSGKLPFAGTSMADVLAAVVRDTPQILSLVCPSVPPALAQVIDRCLEKDPRDRFADVVELTHALAPFASPEKQALINRVKRVVPMRMAAASRPGASDAMPSSSRNISIDKQIAPTMAAVEKGSRGGPSRADSVAPVIVPAKPSRAIVAALVALVIAGIGFVAVRGIAMGPASDSNASPASIHSPASAMVSIAAEPPPVPSAAPSAPVILPVEPSPSATAASTKVKFEFSTKPEKVQVYRDKLLLGTTPLTLEFDRGRTSVKLMFNAWGYRTQEVTIVPEADRAMVIELMPAGAVRSSGQNGGRLPGDLEPF